MSALAIHAQFFHSSADVVSSVKEREVFERPSDGSGCQRSGTFSYVALNCYTQRDSTANETLSGKQGQYSGASYVYENCDDSLFDSLDCLGNEFLGSSAADLSFGYQPAAGSCAAFNCEDNFEKCRPNDKGGLTPLSTKSEDGHTDDNDEIHFGQSTLATVPEDDGNNWQLVAQVQQCHSTPTRCDLDVSFTTDGTCSPAQSPIGGLALNGFWEAAQKTDDPEIQRRPRELSQESDVSVVMKLSPMKTETPPNLSGLVVKPEPQQHTSGPVNGESCQITLPRDLSLVMSMMQQVTKGEAVAQQPATQADNSASIAELLDLPDLIQPTDASSERCKSSIQSVLGKRQLVSSSSSSSLGAPFGSFMKVGQPEFSLETIVVESMQYGLVEDTSNQSLKPGQSAAKRQETLKAEVEELEADNALLHGCLKEFSSLVKGVWAQNRKIQKGIASSGIARSPLDMTLYMTATAASNKDIENKLSGKLESGTIGMELLFNKLSGSA